MHREDKAGLNTLFQRIDGLRLGRRTDRGDLHHQPARRARPGDPPCSALRLSFRRPDEAKRAELFGQSLPEVALTQKGCELIALRHGDDAKKSTATGSPGPDVTDRLIPAAV